MLLKINNDPNAIKLILNIIDACKKIPKSIGEASKIVPNTIKDNPDINKAIKSSQRCFSIVIDDLPSGFSLSASLFI